MFFSVSNEPPIYYYPKAAEVQGIRVWADTNYLRVLLPALLPDKKKRDGCKFLLLPLQAALVQSGALPHFSDCVICVEHIYDHNLPIKAVRDYDNLELKAVIDVIATFCLADDTGALCDSFQTTRFGYSSSTVITVMPKNCFSAWLNAPKLLKIDLHFFRKIRKNQIPVLESDFSALLQYVLYTNQRQLSPESKKARLNSEVISISSAFPILPAQGSLYYELLALTAICGEVPCACAVRLTSSKSYRKKVVTSLTHDKLLRIFSKDHLRGYRLGIRGKRL